MRLAVNCGKCAFELKGLQVGLPAAVRNSVSKTLDRVDPVMVF